MSVTFDEPTLVSTAGLVPLLRLAERAGLHDIAEHHIRLPATAGSAGAHPAAKIASIVAGMCVGADSIDDLGVLRHGALPRLFTGIRAPSTLGSFLRGFAWPQVRALDTVARRTLAGLARATPLLPGADAYAWLDVDSTITPVYGHAKQGAEHGYTRVRGLHPLVATVSTPLAAPVIVATRLRRGSAAGPRGAASFLGEAIRAGRAAGATGDLVARMDAAFYTHAVVTACLRHDVRFTIAVPQDKAIRRAIAAIPERAWRPIDYPTARFDPATGQWISEAQIAETGYVAFSSHRTADRIGVRLVVRRVKDKNVPDRQGELFTAWRYHAIITDTLLSAVEVDKSYREHAIIEQVHADLKDSALAHLPCASFPANAAWLTCAAIAHNLTRAAGCLASTFHARARTGTLRRYLINIPARVVRRARRIILRLPANWPHRHAVTGLFTTTHART